MLLRSARTSSTLLLLAPSISTASTSCPSAMLLQMSHSSHGVGVGPFTQLSAFARIRAHDVFPTPRAPVNRYACATLPDVSALVRALATCSCPIRSANCRGLYRRATTVYSGTGGGGAGAGFDFAIGRGPGSGDGVILPA